MSRLESENIPYYRIAHCIFCDKNKKNRRPKSYKSLTQLLNHLRQCRNAGFVIEYTKLEIYTSVKRACEGNFDAFQRLVELGMIK